MSTPTPLLSDDDDFAIPDTPVPRAKRIPAVRRTPKPGDTVILTADGSNRVFIVKQIQFFGTDSAVWAVELAKHGQPLTEYKQLYFEHIEVLVRE